MLRHPTDPRSYRHATSPFGRALDELYAISLDDDAIPSLVRALPDLEQGEPRYLAEALGRRLDELRTEDGLNAWQAWNAGRAAARDALQAAEDRGVVP